MRQSGKARNLKTVFSIFAAVLFTGGFCAPVPAIPRSSPTSGNGTTFSAKKVFARFARSVVVVTGRTWDGQEVSGSGLIASPEGHVITNAHVVEDVREVEVRQPEQPTEIEDRVETDQTNRFQAPAKAQAPQPTAAMVKVHQSKPALVYVDVHADIAILKTDLKNAPFDLSVTAMPEVGERVYAIGNPGGLENTITDGIVSGLRQRRHGLFIQHSAPIAPGSSGGALVSERGVLVGMNTSSLPDSDTLNFAIPAEALKTALAVARNRTVRIAFPRATVDYDGGSQAADQESPQKDLIGSLFMAASTGLLLLSATLLGCLIFALREIRWWRMQTAEPEAAPRLETATDWRPAMMRRAWLAASLLWIAFCVIFDAGMNDEGHWLMFLLLVWVWPLILGPIALGVYRFIVHGRITAPDRVEL